MKTLDHKELSTVNPFGKCKHRNFDIIEYICHSIHYQYSDGEILSVEPRPGDPTGEYGFWCHDCGFKRDFTSWKMPKYQAIRAKAKELAELV